MAEVARPNVSVAAANRAEREAYHARVFEPGCAIWRRARATPDRRGAQFTAFLADLKHGSEKLMQFRGRRRRSDAAVKTDPYSPHCSSRTSRPRGLRLLPRRVLDG